MKPSPIEFHEVATPVERYRIDIGDRTIGFLTRFERGPFIADLIAFGPPGTPGERFEAPTRMEIRAKIETSHAYRVATDPEAS